jgi:hypothetical protein
LGGGGAVNLGVGESRSLKVDNVDCDGRVPLYSTVE